MGHCSCPRRPGWDGTCGRQPAAAAGHVVVCTVERGHGQSGSSPNTERVCVEYTSVVTLSLLQAISANMERTQGTNVSCGSEEDAVATGSEEATVTMGARLDARLIDTYDGTGDVVEWYTQASLLCEYRGVPVTDVLPLRLKGGAFAVWSQLPTKDRRSADTVKDALFTAFAMDDCAAYSAFVARTLQPGESVDVFLASLRRYADLFGGASDRQLAAAFVNGLPAAVSDAVRAGARAEKLDLGSVLARARAVLGNERVQAVAAARGDGHRRQPTRSPYPRRCWTCGEVGHLSATCPRRSGNAAGAT